MTHPTICLTSKFGSSQQWTGDPEMAIVRLPIDAIEKAEKAIAFLNEHGFFKCVLANVGSFSLADAQEDDDEDNELIEDLLGYVVAAPEYTVAGCDMEVLSYGDIKITFPFEHSEDRGWMTTTWTVDELRQIARSAGLVS